MKRKQKQIKKIEEHSLRWYAAFGFFAFLMIAGVFWMFDIIYQDKVIQADRMSTEMNAAINGDFSKGYKTPNFESTIPALAYVAMALVVIGAVGFVAAKVFYEKSKE